MYMNMQGTAQEKYVLQLMLKSTFEAHAVSTFKGSCSKWALNNDAKRIQISL